MAYGSRKPFRFCRPTRTGTCVLQRRERNGCGTRSETAETEQNDLLQSEGRSQPAPATAKIVFSVVNLNAVGLRQYGTPWQEEAHESSRFATRPCSRWR